MLPANPFLQLTIPRVSRAISRLETLVWTHVADCPCGFAGARPEPVDAAAAVGLSYEPVALPFTWGRLFDRGWFRVELPAFACAGPLYLHWNDQGEGTAHLDGVPFYGFDVAHRYCALPPGATEIFIEGLCLQSGIHHRGATGLSPEGSLLSTAALCRRDEVAWEVLHDLRVLYELALEEAKASDPLRVPTSWGVEHKAPIDVVTVLYRRLLRAMDDAVNALDRGGPAEARTVLRAAYARLGGQNERITAVLTGHAHIDLVWLWPERTAGYKAVHTFSTMNRLMELYPEFRFGYSQPASYDAVERMSPALMGEVRKRIGEGRWEAEGATEVESDTLMACGEALARSFLLGQKGFQRLRGGPSRVLWIPDVFGYCGSLPQIMRQTGVEYFFTTKLTWSNINLFPYSSFLWRGIDGSEVLVHVTQENGYNQVVSPEELRRGARAYRQADVHDEYLSPTGYGDGGGGVTEEMCERARRLKSLAGMPEVRWGSIVEFFEKLDRERPTLPVWQGELYLEYHRGVLTTHGELKALFRASERALQTWEAVRCATGGGEIDEHAWRRVVFAQFHDYIPGSSIWEVYEEGLPELQKIAEDAQGSASRELGGGEGSRALFNPLPMSRIVIDRSGGETVALRLAPLSGAPIAEIERCTPDFPVEAAAGRMRSGSVAVDFDDRGRIAALALSGHAIPMRAPLGELMLFPDRPHEFEAWDIDRQTLSLGEAEGSPAEGRVVEPGGVEGVVEFRRKLGTRSEVLVRYSVDAFHPVVRIDYEIDWHEEHALLKVLFPTAYAGRAARFGAPFGSVLRGQQPGPERDEAMFESAGSRWAIVSDDGETAGLSVITEAKYGFSCRDGMLGVSLLRSPMVTGEDPSHRRLFPPGLRRGGARPAFSDQGRHRIRLAIGFHDGAQPREALAPVLADALFTSPLEYAGAAIDAGFHGLEGGDSLVPCWAKPAADGDGWILRLHETLGRRGEAVLVLRDGLKAWPTDLAESSGGESEVRTIAFKPYELLSLRITSAGGQRG